MDAALTALLLTWPPGNWLVHLGPNLDFAITRIDPITDDEVIGQAILYAASDVTRLVLFDSESRLRDCVRG